MDKLIRTLSSYKASIILLLVYAAGLATATLVEKNMGTMAAKMLIYYSPLFLFLQLLLVVNFLLLLNRYHYIRKKKWTLMVVHVSLIIILGGALTTHLFGREGQMHIREGESSDQMVMHTSRGTRVEKLPFRLELTDFRLHRYPGSESPSSYESSLRIHIDGEIREAEVYMNNVLDLKGYRFFQASYDPDEKGTILSVNKDVAGRCITYTGYLLLLIGFMMMFMMPESRFRKLIQSLREIRQSPGAILLTIFFLLTPTTIAATTTGDRESTALQYLVPSAHAARFGELPVQFRGRIMPMNSFSSEILRKLHKETSISGLNSDQFLLGLLAMPQQWTEKPLIALPGGSINLRYQLTEEYASYSDFFDNEGNYRLLTELQQIYHRRADERTAAEKELIRLDERINIFYQLLHHKMPAIYPHADIPVHSWYAPGDDLTTFEGEDSLFVANIFEHYLMAVRSSIRNGNWQESDRLLQELQAWQLEIDPSLISPAKIKAEIRYNRMNIFSRSRVGYFIFGGLLLIFAFLHILHERKWMKYAGRILVAAITGLFLFHLYGMGLRWYIAGHAPWSNSYETMVYIAWVTVMAGLIFGRRSTLTLALATLFAGVILFVSGLNWMDPQINTLVPVLKSPWLMYHVAVIVAAYGFFGISFLLGTINLLLMTFQHAGERMALRIKELGIINNLSLLAGLALMTVGTFLGAVWANESWGRYWGWDPKETWALITVVVYAIVTHLHLVKRWQSEWLFNLLSVLAFSSVLMTFLGVNYFLSGMHSYGQTDTAPSVFVIIAAAFATIGMLGLVSYKKATKGKL